MPLKITHEPSPTHRGPFGVEVADSDGAPILKHSDPWWRRAIAVWLGIKDPRGIGRLLILLALWRIWRPFRPKR